MLSLFRFALLAVCALFATSVVAMPSGTPTRRMTNAERMRRGLAPNPPHRREQALRARQSTTPGDFAAQPRWCTPRDGLIEAFYNETLIGYIRNTVTGNGTYGITQNRTEALVVHADCDGDFFDLLVIGDTTSTPLLGAFTSLSSDSSDFASGSHNCAQFSGVSHTDAGSIAQFVDNLFTIATSIVRESESAIWSLDDLTNILTASWVNDNSNRAPTSCTYVPDVDILYLTGDVTAFTAAVAPQQVQELTLKLVPQ